MSGTDGMLLFWFAAFDQLTMSQFSRNCDVSLPWFFQMRIKGTKESVVVEAIKMVYCFAPTC